MAELKPCKYCGQRPKVFGLGVRKDNEVWIRCENKNCPKRPFTASYDYEYEAVEVWNSYCAIKESKNG